MAAGSTYEPIATTTLGTATSSVTFSSITSAYTDLILVINGSPTAAESPLITVNSDSGTNYSVTFFRGSGSAASSGRTTSAANINTAINPGANVRLAEIIQFQNYSNTTTYKTIIVRGGTASNNALGSIGLWRNTAAISTILVSIASGNYAVGSTFTLYGIAAA
jgi:hypothetical protein